MKKSHLIRILVIFFVTTGSSAFAELTTTSNSTTSTDSALPQSAESKVQLKELIQNKKFEDDKNITDAKIKADSGSLSKYSLKFNLTYNGAGITDLNNPMTPNPDGTVGIYETALSGSIGGRYRLDSQSSVGIGSGVSATTPIQGTKRYDIKNTFVSYDLTNKYGGFQVRNSFSFSYVSYQIYRNVGETNGLGYDNSVVYYLGDSNVAVGFDTSLAYYIFERGYDKKDGKTNRYSISLFPNVKYNFSDQFSVNTSLALSWWNPRFSQDNTILYNKILSQRIGFGYAYSRDVYFAPYFNFYPDKFNTDSTTINLSTTFSLL